MENRIKELREDRNYKQKEIAKYLMIKQNSYSQLENGKNNISIEYLNKLADFYNVSIDYIMYRTDEKKPYPKSKKRAV